MYTENQPERAFIVLSLKHTHRHHKAITLWRANDSGYCWPLQRAGTYAESLVLKRLGYYNSGYSNIAVPADLVTRLVVDIYYDTKEFGISLPNNAKTWRLLPPCAPCNISKGRQTLEGWRTWIAGTTTPSTATPPKMRHDDN